MAGLAFLPYALYVLITAPFFKSTRTLLLSLIATIVPLVLADKYYYGTWKVSLLNFLQYNVAGGGQSALYGVEGPLFYVRNGFNQLQLVLPLALALPVLVFGSFVASTISYIMPTKSQFTGENDVSAETIGVDGAKRLSATHHRSADTALLVAVSPFFLWFAAVTALEHKEERFLYVVYPLACLAAAVSLEYAQNILRKLFYGRPVVTKGLVILIVLLTQALSFSRSIALVLHYGAPMQVYSHLSSLSDATSSSRATTVAVGTTTPRGSHSDTVSPTTVCVGAEWYRYPSSFFLPGPRYRLKFIKSGFNGLLPRHFEDDKGGSRYASPHLNDKNREEPANYESDAISACDFVVTMMSSDSGDGQVLDGGQLVGGNNESSRWSERWKVVTEHDFVDNGKSPALSRAFYVPRYSSKRNTWLKYVLLQKK